MPQRETIAQFYHEKGITPASQAPQADVRLTGRFNVFERAQYAARPASYNRRDFYKICLLTGSSRFNYASRGVLIDRPALVFCNPLVPYSWEPLSEEQGGFFCLFTEDFIHPDRTGSLQESPLFKPGGDPVFFLDEQQFADVSYLFRKMIQEMATGYLYREDLMRNYVNLIIHEALKLQPHTSYYQHPNAASRIVALFQELLERQFPIDSPAQGLRLRTPADFATNLSVHVNHLNRVVRETTGRNTTQHIADRIIAEAKALLLHTAWSTAEIAYGLGFEYPTYFNNFFKKHTGTTPSAVRALGPEMTAPLAA